jgi:hypothetical protein
VSRTADGDVYTGRTSVFLQCYSTCILLFCVKMVDLASVSCLYVYHGGKKLNRNDLHLLSVEVLWFKPDRSTCEAITVHAFVLLLKSYLSGGTAREEVSGGENVIKVKMMPRYS